MEQWIDTVFMKLPKLKIMEEEPMKKHTTFRVGGPAQYYARPGREELPVLLQMAEKDGIDVTVIGNGSNLLVGDKGIRGLVIELGSNLGEIHIDQNVLKAGAGAMLSQAAGAAATAGLGGMEFAAGIPGSVGGAITMNAGAYGGEMKDIVGQVTVLTEDGKERTLTPAAMDFGYRKSCIFKNHYIVLEAEFLLTPRPEEEIRAKMAELRAKRLAKQPLEYPSAGSTFKRPEGYFAGKLIMDAGLRGYTVGGAQVSEKHCGFVINRGDATAADIRKLMEDVENRVMERFGVRLEPEVKMVGDFS